MKSSLLSNEKNNLLGEVHEENNFVYNGDYNFFNDYYSNG